MVLLDATDLHNVKGCTLTPPYLDKYGEPDPGLRSAGGVGGGGGGGGGIQHYRNEILLSHLVVSFMFLYFPSSFCLPLSFPLIHLPAFPPTCPAFFPPNHPSSSPLSPSPSSPPPSPPPPQSRYSSEPERGESSRAPQCLVPAPHSRADHTGDGIKPRTHANLLVSNVVTLRNQPHLVTVATPLKTNC